MSGVWTRAHWIAVGCCLGVFIAAGLIAQTVLEQVPHLEDEVAYLFQAQVFAAGRLDTPAPLQSNCFFAPFVLDHQGRRFGKYPPGWPALLAIGVRLGQTWWINAGGAALAVALTFRLGSELSNRHTAALAAWLAASSPFVLILAASLMSHTWCMALLTAFVWSFRRSVIDSTRPLRWAFAAGTLLGMAFAIRPYTALAVGFPAMLYTLWRIRRWQAHWRHAWTLTVGFVAPALLVPLFNAIWTGDPLLSPYVLFWPYDRVGFGPGHGPQPEGNTLWIGLGEAVWVTGRLANWLHGWPALSLSFVILGFLFKPRRFWDLYLAGTALSLILAYVAYWTNGNVYGPRYTHEVVALLTILSANGIERVEAYLRTRRPRAQPAFYGLLATLTAIALFIYLPWQLHAYRGLYGITAQPQKIVAQADLHNALVIVHTGGSWKEYAPLFALNSPTLDGDIVFASECGPFIPSLIAQFSDRQVYYFDGTRVYPYHVQQ